MKISFEIEGASPEFEREILALLSKCHKIDSAELEKSKWNPTLARHYMELATVDIRTLISDVIRGDGWIGAAELRASGRDLRIISLSVNRAIQRGIKERVWPDDIKPPINLVYEPSASGRKAKGYIMDRALISIFSQACKHFGDLPPQDAPQSRQL